MDSRELALLYLDQVTASREGRPASRTEPNALWLWEEWIGSDPEMAWPVFSEILSRCADDDTIEQVWFRVQLLLSRHYDQFHERVRQLLTAFPRLEVISRHDSLDRDDYVARPLDPQELIVAYEKNYQFSRVARRIEQLGHSDPLRAFGIVLEIIHRGALSGWAPDDLASPLHTLLSINGERIVDEVEKAAKESAPLRRVLWRLRRQVSFEGDPGVLGPEMMRSLNRYVNQSVWERLSNAAGETTAFTPEPPNPEAEPHLDGDEQLIEGWFESETSSWAFDALYDLVRHDPAAAFDVTKQLIDRCPEGDDRLWYVAAGPLEDLLKRNHHLIWAEVVERAHTNPRFQHALRGVWLLPEHAVYDSYVELMQDLEPAN